MFKETFFLCCFLKFKVFPPLTELSAAARGWPHFDRTSGLLCVVDWWLLSRERFQPSSAGV